MGIRESLLAPTRKPSWAVLINGLDVTYDAISGTTEASFDTVNRTAKVLFRQRPAGAEESGDLQLWMGYDGESAPVFTGVFSGVNWDMPGTVELAARGKLWRTLQKWGGPDRIYTEQTSAEVIRNLLEAVGITAHNIEDNSPPWVLGRFQDVVLKTDETIWSLIQRIDTIEGFITFEGPDGGIYRRRIVGNPSNSTVWDFVEGTDVINGGRERGIDGAINQWTINGLALFDSDPITATVNAPNSYLDAEVAPELRPRYVPNSITDDLVETEEDALTFAQRKVGDTNRRPESATVSTDGNPLVQLAASVSLTSPTIAEGYALAIVKSTQHSFGPDGFFSTIGTNGGTFSGYNASAPYAQFTTTANLEHEELEGGDVAERIIVVANGIPSFDPDGPESEMTFLWAYAVDAGTVEDIGGTTGRKLRLLISGAATQVTITLTVTDVQGYTNTLTRIVPLSPRAALLINALWTAEGALNAYSGDGQKTWNEEAPASDTNALVAIAPSWGNIYGGADGHIYASFDGQTSPMIDLGQPAPAAGACTAVYVHELSNIRLWAGFADGTVVYGFLDLDAQTVSWFVRGNVGAGPVREIVESYNTPDELRVTAGDRYSISRDGGQTWQILQTGDTAWRMTAGHDRQFVGFLNDDDPLREENGHNITLPVLVPPIRHIRGLTMGWQDRVLYFVDDEGRIFRADIDSGVAVQTGQSPVGINHMIRCGGGEDGVLFLAGGDNVIDNAGVLKSIDGTDPFYLRRTEVRAVAMVGYGPLVSPGVPPIVATIYRPTRGVSPGGVYKYDFMTNTWPLKNTGLPTGIYWFHLAASPQNPSKLLLLGTSDPGNYYRIVSGTVRMPDGVTHPCWRSDDAGETFYAQPLTAPSGTQRVFRLGVCEWDKADASKALISGLSQQLDDGFAPAFHTIWRLSGSSTTPVRETDLAWQGNYQPAAAAGSDGDIVSGINTRFGYLPAAAGAHTQVGTMPSTTADQLITWPGTNRGAMIVGEFGANVRTSPDYRVAALSVRTGGVWASFSRQYFDVLADGSVIVATASNFMRLTNPFGAVSATPVGPSGAPRERFYTRVDRQQYRVVAAVTGADSVVAYFDGNLWQDIPGPAGVSAFDLANMLEVVAP